MAGGSLLIIEDEKRLRDNLQTLLCQEGYTVTTAADGREGLQHLQHTSFDVVLTDIKMEGLDGFGIMEYLAAHAPDLPVIVMTGYASTESVLEALRRGAYDYIAKPFEIEMLQVAIERALEKVRLRREVTRYIAELESRVAELTTTTVSKRFVDNIIRAMADMLIVINTNGTIRTVNEAAATILGYTVDELQGQPWHTICPDDTGDASPESDHSLSTDRVRRHETIFLARDGGKVQVSLARSPLYDDEDILQGSVCMAQDITERRRAEDALRANEAWLRLLTTQMPAVLWTTDMEFRLTAFLGTGLSAWPTLPRQHEEGRRPGTVFQIDSGVDFVATVAHGNALRGESVIQEVQHGGRTFHAHVEPLRNHVGAVIGTIGVALDITEHKWQEEERRKIAYEIHDGVAQLLVSAQQHLDAFADLWQRRDALAQPQLEKGIDRLTRAIVEARRLMAHLRPVALETQGLIPAIRCWLEELGKEAGWEMEYSEEVENPVLSPDGEAAVFRIVQEALTNVWKHAHTPKVRMALKTNGAPHPALSIVVQDWGTGFQPDSMPLGTQGLGLLGMRERARMVGGTCTIESRHGQGTTVRVQIPLPHRDMS